ncbi:MAG: DUF4347 domain-containing protein [Flavobacteriaceae bacterium]
MNFYKSTAKQPFQTTIMKTTIKTILSTFIILMVLGCGKAIAQTDILVVIDQDYAKRNEVLSQLPSGAAVINLKSNSNPWKDIREKLTSDKDLKQIHLFVESGFNSLLMAGIEYNAEKVQSEFELSMLEGIYTGIHYQLYLYTCNLPSNPEGLELIKELGNKTYFNIAASTNCQEGADHDFNFDYTTLDQPIAGSIFKI